MEEQQSEFDDDQTSPPEPVPIDENEDARNKTIARHCLYFLIGISLVIALARCALF
jgi:hypothetical protein